VQDGVQADTNLANVNYSGLLGVVVAEKLIDDHGTEHRSGDSVGLTEESQIENLSAVGGLISADVLHSTANTTITGLGVNNHNLPGDSAPSGLVVVNLNVFGHIYNGSVPANTTITLSPGNYVVLNEQTPGPNGITVNAIDIHLAALGVFAGSAEVAHAQTSLTASTPVTVQYAGDAYTADLQAHAAGVNIDTGNVADAGVGCGGGTATNSIASNNVKLPNGTVVLASGTGQAAVSAGQHSTPDITSSEDIQHINLLGGLIKADALHVTSTTATDGSGTVSSTGGTGFVNLVINGHSIGANPAPNTTIAIPGIGSVVLNEQNCANGTAASCSANGNEHLGVNAIDVELNTNNSLHLPVSTTLVVAHADSGFTLVS
jgi:hypothetical protein